LRPLLGTNFAEKSSRSDGYGLSDKLSFIIKAIYQYSLNVIKVLVGDFVTDLLKDTFKGNSCSLSKTVDILVLNADNIGQIAWKFGVVI